MAGSLTDLEILPVAAQGVGTPTVSSDGPVGGHRRIGRTTRIAAAVVAGLAVTAAVAWAGRGGPSSPVAGSGPTTVSTPLTTVASSGGTLVAPVAPTPASVELLGPLLADAPGLDLVTLDVHSVMRRINLVTGRSTLVTTVLPPNPQQLWMGSVGPAVVVVAFDEGVMRIVRPGASTVDEIRGSRLWKLPNGTALVERSNDTDSDGRIELVHYDGDLRTELGRLSLPAYLDGYSVVGNDVLLGLAGVVYRLDQSTGQATPLLTGRLLTDFDPAVSDSLARARVLSCVPSLRCRIREIDASGGSERDHEVTSTAEVFGEVATPSPDGRYSVVSHAPVNGEEPSVAIESSAAGTLWQSNGSDEWRTYAGIPYGSTERIWSPDSRFLLFNTAAGVQVWRAGSGGPVELGIGPFEAIAFAPSER